MMMKRIAVAIAAAAVLAAPLAAIPAGPAAADLDAPWCHADDLRASYRSTGAGVGHAFGVIRLKNVSDHPCVTSGYGGLSYVGHGDGTQIGTAAWRTPSRVRLVLLHPGERAVSAVDEANARNFPKKRCHPVHVDGFRVYAPDTTRSKFVRHPTIGCEKRKVHLLTHKAFRAARG
jgi:hypothetical protein